VTILAEAGAGKGNSFPVPRLGQVVLILSLALNLFIAGGFFYSQMVAGHPTAQSSPQTPPQGPERRLEELAKRVGIDPATSRPFKEMRRGFRLAQQAMGAKNRPLGGLYWEELASAQPDQKHLEDLVDQMIANRHAFQSEVTGIFVRFMAALSPEQREALVKIVEDKADPMGAPVRQSVGN
jgi:Spy/CpxP family protein refolding chaperone